MNRQIALPLGFDRQFSFDNFFSPDAGFVISSLKTFVDNGDENFIILWGGRDSGKTHLLNATARYARDRETSLQLFDATLLVDMDSSCLGELPGSAILAIDNLDAISGDRDWEICFYDLINRCRRKELSLLLSLSSKPQYLNCALADFQSRLNWGLLLELRAASEADIGEIIRQRARLLGHRLSDDVIAFLIRHYPRGLGSQIDILRKLDAVSLATGKRITVPLIRQEIGYREVSD